MIDTIQICMEIELICSCLVIFGLKMDVWRKTMNENWRKRYNKQLMQLFGDSDKHSIVRVSQLNWIGHVKRTDSKRKISEIFNNNHQGGLPKIRP